MTRRILIRLLAATAVTYGLIVAGGGGAQAETNPACPGGVTKIGTTGYLTVDGATFASVKQVKGRGLNWGYLYV